MTKDSKKVETNKQIEHWNCFKVGRKGYENYIIFRGK